MSNTSLTVHNLAFEIEKGESVRLDVWLATETEYTRSRIKRLIDDGSVLVNGEKSKSGRLLKEGDSIMMTVAEQTEDRPVPKDIPIQVLFEDDDIIVINKQRGLTVHPGAGNVDETLVGALLYRGTPLSDINGAQRPGIVHRLDKDTSGVMVVAKNNASHLALARQFAERTTVKKYVALLIGNLADDKGILTTFIGRNPSDRTLMTVTKEGRIAITEYRVIERYERYCLAEFILHTGRTHQIRGHCKHLGHPIIGDIAYGGADKRFGNLGGQLLHSKSLIIAHPKSGESMTFIAPEPEIFVKVRERLASGGAA